MIADMSDFGSVYRGETAQYIDSCTLSSGGGPIPIKNFKLSSDGFEHYILGQKDKDGAGCFQFANFEKWAPWAARSVFDGSKYMLDNYQ